MTDLKQTVRDINAAFERGDVEGFLVHCTDDIKWSVLGESVTIGKEPIRQLMAQRPDCKPPVIGVEALIREGAWISCSGGMTMEDQNGATIEYGYCDVYRFEGDKVAELFSYIVEISPKH